MRRHDTLTLLQAHRGDLERLGIRSLRLFGSTARDEATPGSDVDLLVDFAATPTFSEFMKVRIFLEDLLGQRVDLVTETGLRPQVRPFVEKDAIRVA
jgi:predicted nucleotidyltransferase